MTVAIVGAGHAGLCVAGALRRRGVGAVVVFDSADRLGDTWRARYDELVLNTHRDLSRVPDVTLPADVGEWPTRDQWAAHIERAAEVLGVERRTDHVRRVERAGGGWRLVLGDGPDGGAFEADVVVVATGRNRVPVIPEWPGRERTQIELLHAAAFRRGADFAGRRVLVVGAGNSGTEIAHLLASAGVDVALAMRTRPVWAKREFLGTDLTHTAVRAKRLPDPVIDVLGRMMQWTLFRGLRRHGLGPPEQRLSNVAHASGATLDSGFVDDVKAGRIRVVGAFERFGGGPGGDVAVLAGGERLAVDVVIAATGYATGLEELLPGDVLRDGWPIATEPPFRSAPGLYSAGLNPATLSAFHPDFIVEAEQIADDIVAAVGGIPPDQLP